MKLFSKEHDELMKMFEKFYPGYRLDREAKEDWKKGIIYQNGEVNSLFLAFRKGVSYGMAVERSNH